MTSTIAQLTVHSIVRALDMGDARLAVCASESEHRTRVVVRDVGHARWHLVRLLDDVERRNEHTLALSHMPSNAPSVHAPARYSNPCSAPQPTVVQVCTVCHVKLCSPVALSMHRLSVHGGDGHAVDAHRKAETCLALRSLETAVNPHALDDGDSRAIMISNETAPIFGDTLLTGWRA